MWAFATAGAAEIMWQAHRSDAANALWQSLVPWESVDSLGHMHEVMPGSFLTPQRESVPEQTWSSSAFLSAAIHGMLGLEADGRTKVLHFTPQAPASYQSLRVEKVVVRSELLLSCLFAEVGAGFEELWNAT